MNKIHAFSMVSLGLLQKLNQQQTLLSAPPPYSAVQTWDILPLQLCLPRTRW